MPKLNLLDRPIPPYFAIVITSVSLICKQYGIITYRCVYMLHLRTKFYTPGFNYWMVIIIKPIAKENIPMNATLLLALREKKTRKVEYSSKIYLTSFQDH
jgi:hypothetical protein